MRHLAPQQPGNLWPAKAYAGEVVPFEATVFREGHDRLGVRLIITDPTGRATTFRMRSVAAGTDRWRAELQLNVEGTWTWKVRAFADDWATWLHNAEVKIPAGIDVDLMITMGRDLLERAGTRKVVADAAAAFADPALSPEAKLAVALDPRLTAAIEAKPLASLTTESEPLSLRVERPRAGVGSWYEFFPRSEGAKRAKDGTWTSGTFRTAAKRLPAVAEMGFDVLYLPPIHPIGHAFRKGPNNSLVTQPGDPGSPWAIGSADGGHDAVHPDLGTVKDFQFFLQTANKLGIEVALDFALQCSPDHPWVTEHPEWFTHLPDGSIAYAENPPKKYQDIYPINFDTDPVGIRTEVLRLLRYWIGLGVRIFRVDNPHTKPLQFWEVVLHEINTEFPDVVFLAEAFTRPAMLHSLAQVGYQQSYTYFTWRNTKAELEEFFTSISHETSAFLRPNLFVNTPDILTEYLQFGGLPAYRIRAALAATASPSWGVYAGYELFEHVARPGSEENIDNEKYEYKQRDWAAAEKAGTSLAPYLTRLNLIRAAHPALRQLRNLDVHWSDDDSILVYSKFLDGAYTEGAGTDALIMVVNVDPHSVRETMVHLDLTRLGLAPDARFTVRDLLTGDSFEWGRDNYVRLDAFTQPLHILHVEYPKGR
ncbi:alpha-1,4-glucan--maltose-1-phosphate maltosyltransferase [Protaetiibacter sp. WY-16]|uniref:Alpha-1,4-glucan:maltose-1-phosphate maltosyltransferase n=1 Tax=Antiquaquibacter soli TaxID=3064523 RepID=A0ABT9BN51_9MICO|nr:alpha-1,4-glucan--maltose-1-phosphate maltosyltransferase [Protaetiibacter sp. WY-16]MDO7882466.1 alpha-1,4-glucan--maltose-1-phosphate maltosyltransferase [Protaetiibacter sp. WY-16]